MITPSHVIFNLALLGSRARPQKNSAIFMGALAPDIIVYFIFLIRVVGQGLAPDESLIITILSPEPYISLSHSLIVVPLLWVIASLLNRQWFATAFLSSLLHIIFDFFLHHSDAYMHFYPLTTWRFVSPISFWDPNHYGTIISTIEFGLLVVMTLIAWPKVKSSQARIALTFTTGILVMGFIWVRIIKGIIF